MGGRSKPDPYPPPYPYPAEEAEEIDMVSPDSFRLGRSTKAGRQEDGRMKMDRVSKNGIVRRLAQICAEFDGGGAGWAGR